MRNARDDFSEFVVNHEQQLLRAAYLLTGDRGHAEDLLQTALSKAFRHWTRVGSSEHPAAYVRRAMVNTHISWRRRLMSTEQVIGTIPDRGGEDVQSSSAVEDEVWQALLSLSPRVRAVLVLRFYEDLTEPETARVLGCSISSVNTYTARGLAALKRLLDRHRETDLASPRRQP